MSATILSPTQVNATNIASETRVASDVDGERTNVQFLEGTPGDTYLIYTYQQDGNMYKAIETATEDFRNVKCQIFQLNASGNYVENSIQRVSIDKD